MSMFKNVVKMLAAQTVVGLAVNSIQENVINPLTEKVKKTFSKKQNNDRRDYDRR